MNSIARLIIFIAASGVLIYFTAHKLSNLPSGVNADSSAYLFDNLFEKIKLALLRDPDAKLEQIIEFSKEKINEMKDLEDKNKSGLLEKVYEQNNDYVAKAIKQIEKIKESGEDASLWEKQISEQVLEQKEILTLAQEAAPTEAKTIIENGIAAAEKLSNSIMEKASEQVKEIIVYQIKRVEAAVEDKKEEAEVISQQEEKILLTDDEKIYDIWIESLYAKTMPKNGEPFYIRAHIKRRDDECKFFGGELIIEINGQKFSSQINNMMPSDDLWMEIGPIEMEKGTFDLSGKLFDKQNKLISIKNLKILVD